jgi:hypothetical protein
MPVEIMRAFEQKFGCAPAGDRCPDMSMVNR